MNVSLGMLTNSLITIARPSHRKNRHLPQFHKRHATEAMDPKAVKRIGRRAHGIARSVTGPSPTTLQRAEQRRAKYLHRAARVREFGT